MYWTQTLLPLSRYKDVMPSFLHASPTSQFLSLLLFCCPLSPLIFLKGLISSISPVGYSQRVNYSRGPCGPALYQVDPRLVCHFVYAAVYLTRSRVRGPSRDGPLIVTLTPELTNNPHYGVADSSWKSWFMNMLGAEACWLSLLALRSSTGISGRHRPCASTFLSSPFPLSVLVITGTLHQETVGRSESLRYDINGSCPLRPRNKRISCIGA